MDDLQRPWFSASAGACTGRGRPRRIRPGRWWPPCGHLPWPLRRRNS